ncbi:hypothetical protein CVT26_015586, partial [Gymnopilus dilepis]
MSDDTRARENAKDAHRSELNDFKLVVVKAQGNVLIELIRVSSTIWKQRNQDPMPVPSKGLVLVATSESRGDLGFGYIEEDLSECLGMREELEWNLKLQVENSPALSISFKLNRPETQAENLEEQMDRKFASQLFYSPKETLDDPMMFLGFVQSLPDDDPIKADGLNAIGDELREKFTTTQDRADIDASINAYEQALKPLSADDDRFSVFICDAGLAYTDRFSRYGDIKDIDVAIEKLEIGLAMHPEGHKNRPKVLNNLGACFRKRFERMGNIDDLSQSIQLGQEALDLTPEGDADMPSLLNNIGNRFSRQFQRTGTLNDLDQAIQLQQRAAKLTPEGHADLPSVLNNLGNSLRCRFEHTGDLHDIAESIQLQQRAVKLTPE